MKPSERWQEVKEILFQALEMEAAERPSFLDQKCGDDAELRQEIESLIIAHSRAAGRFESPAVAVMAAVLSDEGTREIVGRQFGHYQVIEKLGAGGMGEVFLAEDPTLSRKVALKLLPSSFTQDSERLRRFEQEARAASALNHPNILTIHEIGHADSVRYIATEFVDGETLRKRINRGPLKVTEALEIAVQIAGALEAAHAAGIIHRDVKPENIMLRHDGIVKVVDFGLAKPVARPASDSGAPTAVNTAAGIIIGTARYMSPEQARGLELDPRTDIFSLGVVIYEMLGGRAPFEGETLSDVIVSLLEKEPTSLKLCVPEVPPELEGFVTRALAKDRTRRYQAVEDLALDLKSLRQEVEFQTRLANIKRAGPGGEIGGLMSRSPRQTVGREEERAALRSGLESAAAGRGLIICVSGEPGIGKTTLVEDFLAETGGVHRCTIARGRSSERLAGTEAYLPLLEALESLLQNYGQAIARQRMKQIAPTWYARLVPVTGEGEGATQLSDEIRAASQERIKRELAALLQEISSPLPLVMFLDDLHWADVSTVDLLNFLAGRFEALGVLVIVTYRTSDMLLLKHPFLQIKPDLQARGVCRELALGFLTEAEVAEYLNLEFPAHNFPVEFPHLIHSKTEGSPLFMVDLVRYLRDRNVIEQADVGSVLAGALPEIEQELPESVRGMIERKIAQLSEEDRRLLVAASVQGIEFDSTIVAQVLHLETDEVEERLERLERVYAFVRLVGEREFPGRALSLRYGFVHGLYQNALYYSLRATRVLSLNRQTALAVEGLHGELRASVAVELATLWEGAREYARAAEYFLLAAQQAGQVFATREAAGLARSGLRMIEMLPDSRERRERELSLRFVLGNAVAATEGYAAPEVEDSFARARELVQDLGETRQLLPAMWGLLTFDATRGQERKALEYSNQFLRLSERLQDPAVVVGHNNVGVLSCFLGELEQASDHLQRSASLYSTNQHRPLTWLYGHEPGMIAHIFLSWTRWLQGQPDQAREHCLEGMRLGREASHANSQGYALTCSAITYLHCGDWQRAGELADEAIAFSTEQGLVMWLAAATMARGSAMVGRGEAAGGIEELLRGLAAYRSTGAEWNLTYVFSLLAEAYGKVGRPHEGLAILDEAQALVENNDERFWEAELNRLRGGLLVGTGRVDFEVEACFRHAVAIARRQGAKSLELRAVTSLSHLCGRQGKEVEARRMLSEVYSCFTEGFDTADLRAADELLTALR